ncbi:MAG: response regulator, partial [Methanobacterium sp.]
MIATQNETKHSPRDILLIEDNPADIRLIEEVLKDEKTENNLSSVVDGTAALKYLHGHCEPKNLHCPNLIILDLNLPKKNGLEVLEDVKNDEKLHEIPIVVFTTSSREEDGLNCKNMGVDLYITKPIDFDGFKQVI